MAQLDKDTFISVLSAVMKDIASPAIYAEIWNAYNTNYKDSNIDVALLPDVIIGGKDKNGRTLTPLFNKEFAGYLAIKNNEYSVTGITTLAEYSNARQSYKDLFSAYGLKDMASNDNIDKFLAGNVSVIEAQQRMSAAYQAIQGADSILKQQLGGLGLTDSDLAKALLTGKEGAIELENKIKTANIRAAEVQAGMESALGAGELARQGISRNQAAQGLAATKMQLAGYEAEATRQGDNAAGIQSELEKENILGLASQRRKKIQQGAAARFGGSSGTMQSSLGKSAAGSI